MHIWRRSSPSTAVDIMPPFTLVECVILWMCPGLHSVYMHARKVGLAAERLQ